MFLNIMPISIFICKQTLISCYFHNDMRVNKIYLYIVKCNYVMYVFIIWKGGWGEVFIFWVKFNFISFLGVLIYFITPYYFTANCFLRAQTSRPAAILNVCWPCHVETEGCQCVIFPTECCFLQKQTRNRPMRKGAAVTAGSAVKHGVLVTKDPGLIPTRVILTALPS